ncbi:MAG: hypothetical protein HFF04_08690 [Oscillospiraceae bacterium]|nr:hypothetical protein [Oscillospiraceae bacterium]
MEVFKAMFAATLSVFQVEFTLYGFTFSMWDVFLWTGVAGLILAFVGGLLSHD